MRPADALAAKLAGGPGALFAVVDGARFADAPAMFARAGMDARSLFLEHRNPGVVAAGPFLAALDGAKLARLLRVEGIEAACVFWRGEVAEPGLFRHLRGINLAEIPRAADAPPDPFAAAADTVLFRHWDPSVLALTLPVLAPAQRARLFGPMARLVLFDAASGRALQALARADWPPPARGFLRISQAQMDEVAGAMAARSRRAVAAYLRDAAPGHAAGMDDAALLAGIARSEASGRAMGLSTELGLGRWAYLMLVSRGAIADSSAARAFVTSGQASSDTQVGFLMLGVARELTRREQAA